MRRKKYSRILVGKVFQIVASDGKEVMIRLLDTEKVRSLEGRAWEESVTDFLEPHDFEVIYPTSIDLPNVTVFLNPL